MTSLLPGDALFLDFDGTLVDIAPRPELVVVEPLVAPTLARLQRALGGALALVSGRPLRELDAHLALELPGAGIHGAERRGIDGRIATHAPVPLDEVVDCAEALATGLPGVRVERKPNAVALHYRQAPEHAPACRQALRRVLARHPALKLMEGKMVLEVLPRDIGKGHAIEAFLAEPPFAGRRPVFVGDDVTDEAGFEAVLRLGGVAIKVGPGSSLAEQRLDSAAAVRRWLLAQAEALST